jgi:uncharacterized iron-regulated protein
LRLPSYLGVFALNPFGDTCANCTTVATLDTLLADPDMETLRQKIKEWLAARRR